METIRQASLIYLSPFDWKVSEGDEGTANASLNIQLLNGVPNEDVSVDYATQDGTATAGQDYTATSGTLTFAAYTTNLTQTISIPILGGTTVEPNEYLNIFLSNPTNAIIQPSITRIEIVNDDQETLLPPSPCEQWRRRDSDNHAVPLAQWRIDFVSAHVDHEPVVLE